MFMGVFSFSLKMLRKEYKKSLIYMLTLLFTISVCFIFFDLMDNQLIIGHEVVKGSAASWAEMSIPISTVLPFLIIMFCCAMIVFANNFYLLGKTKEMAICSMSGSSFIDNTLYLTYQNIAISMIAFPIGLILGYILSVLSHLVMYYYLNIQTSIFMTTSSAFTNTIATVFTMIVVIIIFSSGFIHRNDIQVLLSTQTVNVHEDKRLFKFPRLFYVGLYIFGIILMLFSEYSVSIFAVPCFLGILGAGGMMSHVFPYLFSKLKQKFLLDHDILLISVSNLSYSLKHSILFTTLYSVSSAGLIALLISQQNSFKEFVIVFIGYIVVSLLLSVSIFYKYLLDIMERGIFYFNLYKLGYIKKKLKRIIKSEVMMFYSIIILIPLIYIFIIEGRCLLHHNITLLFGIILILIEVIPMCLVGIMTYYQYRKVVFETIEEGVRYE